MIMDTQEFIQNLNIWLKRHLESKYYKYSNESQKDIVIIFNWCKLIVNTMYYKFIVNFWTEYEESMKWRWRDNTLDYDMWQMQKFLREKLYSVKD